MKTDSRFFQRSLNAAEGFLQTAVVIDDRAFQLGSVREPAPVPLISPPTPSSILIDEDTFLEPVVEAAQSAETAIIQLDDVNPHALDAREVIESFAQRGIICSVLQRAPEVSPTAQGQSPRRLLDPADIIIIDWQVHHEDGSDSSDSTLDFLEDSVKNSSRESPEQLRVTIVYTGALELLKVAEAIEERLESVQGLIFQKDGDYAFKVGSSRIVVLGKPNRYRTAQDKLQQVENDSELAQRATQEFAAMTAGLVSNVVLQGLTEIRRATHRILSKFPSSIDAAFLAHRSLLDPPDEGNEHLLPLLCAEIQAVLEAAKVINEPSNETIVDWLSDQFSEIADSQTDINDRIPSLLGLFYIAEFGINQCLKDEVPELEWLGKWEPQIKSAKLVDEQIDKLPSYFQGVPIPHAHALFSELMALRPRYGDIPPTLALGTILEKRLEVKDGSGKKKIKSTFWLCLQPLCDCVRLDKPRAFPLIPLQRKQSGWFSISLMVDGTPLSLRIDPRVHETVMIVFKPSEETRSVIATQDDSKNWWFPSDEFQWRWLGDLKFEQAQRAVQAFANQNSRVGLTEAEWQRRKALR